MTVGERKRETDSEIDMVDTVSGEVHKVHKVSGEVYKVHKVSEEVHKVIAIDFDGTLFETEYPYILRPRLPVIEAAKKRRAEGDKLILWTCREGPELEAAVEACREQGLEFDAVNDNLPEMKEKWGNNPRKVGADEYWDDRSLDEGQLQKFAQSAKLHRSADPLCTENTTYTTV